jgi:tryptophan 2,3-dioxygenase
LSFERPNVKNTYAGYLGLQQLLSAQKLQTGSDDELLFIIIHQQHELWFKLAIHELDCAIKSLMKEEAQDADCIIAFKRLSRVSAIQHILISSWDVMATLTPDEFFLFRETVGRDGASGFQSVQYRILEYKLGLKYRFLDFELPGGRTQTIDVFENAQSDHEKEQLRSALAAPAICDAVISYMRHRGFAFGRLLAATPQECGCVQGVEPCLSKPLQRSGVVPARRKTGRSGRRVSEMAFRAPGDRIAGDRRQYRNGRVYRIAVFAGGRQPAVRAADVSGAVGRAQRNVQPPTGIRPHRRRV